MLTCCDSEPALDSNSRDLRTEADTNEEIR